MGRDARDSEVAAHLQLSLDEYHQVLQDTLACRVLSMEELLDSGDSAWERCTRASDEPSDRVVQEGFREALVSAIASLPDRERKVISLYYEDERNLKEIGIELGVTESRVCQVQGQALLRLRARLMDWLDEMPAVAGGRSDGAGRRKWR
jgi:RNA polymerase sigma factor for flagellar operon FliA